jgi:CDP-glycerol glycerophosphotransferase
MQSKTSITLSVVVPVYNVALYLDQCLTSIFQQGLQSDDFEIILIDDGSTDGSDLLAKMWSARHENIRLLQQENAGLSAARNAGLDAASGEFLVFVDSDDVIPDFTYTRMIDLLRESGSDFATSPAYRFDRNTKLAWPFARNIDLYKRTEIGLKFTDRPEFVRDFTAWNKVYRLDFFLSTGVRFPEGRIYEDIATSPILYHKATSFDVFADPGYFWRVTPGGITQTIRREKAIDRLWAIDHILTYFKTSGAPSNICDEFDFAIIDYNLRWIFLEFRQYDPQTQLEILTESERLTAHIDESVLGRIAPPLVDWARLAKAGELPALRDILNTPVALLDKAVETQRSSPSKRLRHSLSNLRDSTISRVRESLRRLKQVSIYLVLRPITRSLPLLPRTVVVSSYWGTRFSLADGPPAIAVALAGRELGYSFVVFASKTHYELIHSEAKSLLAQHGPVSIIPNESLRYYYYLWRAKFLVNDVNFPLGFRVDRFVAKRRGQVEIQTTHGIPIKKMGLDSEAAIEPSHQRKFLARSARYDYLVSSSPTVAEIFRKAHGIDPQILKTGLPQHDFLFQSHSATEIYSLKLKYGLDPAKKTIVYAPTFRNRTGEAFPYLIDFGELFSEFGDSYQIVIKIHPFNYTHLDMIAFAHLLQSKQQAFIHLFGETRKDSHYFPVTLSSDEMNRSIETRVRHEADINELILLSDVFVTDYSSTMFGATHTDKPLILFTPDSRHYGSTRGTYFDIESVAPGAVAKNTEDLIAAIKISEDPVQWNKLYRSSTEAFRKEFLLWENGSAADKVVNQIFNCSVKS